MMAKTIQIVLGGRDRDELYALRDNGNIWVFGSRGWGRIEAIPDDPEDVMIPLAPYIAPVLPDPSAPKSPDEFDDKCPF